MKIILHLSDFHLTAKMEEPKNNKIIRSLIDKLSHAKIKIDVIVHTGDLIDSAEVSNLIGVKSDILPEEEQIYLAKISNLWDYHANEAFVLAQQ